MEIKTSEFFKNIKKLPPPNTKEFEDLVNWEIDKCLGGVTINGVFITPWLYWHLNHWWIRVDYVDEFGNDQRRPQLPDLRDNEWIRAEIYERCRLEKKGYMEIGARQGAKALINSSKLYQLDKEITIGECNVGDRIYDESGNLTTILAKYPQGKKSIYRLSLQDGRYIDCDLGHKWKVWDRFKNKSLVKTTEELLVDYKKERASWKDVRKNSFEYRYSIENNQPVKYSQKELPIAPYVFGLWLGDGSNSYSKITSVDKEIIDYLYKYAESVNLQITKDGEFTYMITSGIKGGVSTGKNFIHDYLKSENLYNNKHIPDCYKYSSIEQRLELLRGLMDSDGYSATNRYKVEFTTTISSLSKDFYTLCRSLGINLSRTKCIGKYKKDGKVIECKEYDRYRIYTDKPIFKLTRKVNPTLNKIKYNNRTPIVDIKYLCEDDATCIVVDNESHLFLTDNYTVTHNSEFEASQVGYSATLFENSQNVIVGGSDPDLTLLKDKVDFGLKKLWTGIGIPKLDKTWRGNQIRLGYKKQNGDDDIWSYILIRNADDGNNTETAAGTTAKSYVMDEVGKYKFASVYRAARPAFVGKNGMRAVPILVGTGGAFEKGEDAERYFNYPEENGFLGIENPENGKKTALFISGLYRQDCKEETNLADWLRKERGLKLKDDSELKKITIWASNKEKALKLITEERDRKKKDPDQTEYLKEIMYFPLTPEECFLTPSRNIFNVAAAKAQKARIYEQGITGQPVFLLHDGEKIVHEFTDKRPISQFPINQNMDKDAPIVIWEFPVSNAPYGLYTAGVDSYVTEVSENSPSLGAVYIFKRIHNIFDEGFQNMIVASYVARPEDKRKWQEQARLLIKYYNARTLVENNEISFIDYMISKGDERYLEPEPKYLKGLLKHSTVNNKYGIHRSAMPIVNHLHSTFKLYMEDVIKQERDEQGAITKELTGIYQILDPMLLEEVIKFNPDGNFDRVIAAELAISLGDYLNRSLGTISSSESDPRLKQYFEQKKARPSVFGNTRSIFNRKRR